jgi:hypothetical protein
VAIDIWVRGVSVKTNYFSASSHPQIRGDQFELFRFLQSLNSLQSLSLDCGELALGTSFTLSHLPSLVEATRTAPLRQLYLRLHIDAGFVTMGTITPGPADLETLCIEWDATDDIPAGSLPHLYGFIRPSLSSLSELNISVSTDLNTSKEEFDLTFLKDAGEKMRKFRYMTYLPSENAGVIRTVAEIFPKLTNLCLVEYSIWTVRSALHDDFCSIQIASGGMPRLPCFAS